MKKTFILMIGLMLLFVATASGQSSTKKAGISIDSRIKYQHVTGFGGFSPSPQWSYWLGDAEMNKLFGKGAGCSLIKPSDSAGERIQNA